jgi:hypothetical protein
VKSTEVFRPVLLLTYGFLTTAVLSAQPASRSLDATPFVLANTPADTVRFEPLAKIRVAQNGQTLETTRGQPFVPFGVNYFRPGTGWAPQVWKQFDADALRKDFARMKELGINCVRVFLSYGSFLMETNRLSPEGLDKLDQFLAIAEEAGIYVHPTGPDHWEGTPDWAKVDRYADEVSLRAVEFFWTEIARRYRGRSVILAYDLLNEPEIRWDTPPMRAKWNRWLEKKYGIAEKLAQSWNVTNQNLALGDVPIPSQEDCGGCPQLLDFQRFRENIADDWTGRQVAAIKTADPQALTTVGLIQWSIPSLLADNRQYSAFRPRRIARFVDFMEVHFYPLANGFYEYKSEDEARNLAYLESVTRQVARCGKPVVIAECGWYGGGKPTFGNHAFASEQQQAQWCNRLVESTAGLACGWLNWGLHDHPGAKDVTEFCGLLTADGKVKAWGLKFRELSGRYSQQKIAQLIPARRPDMNWDLCITSSAERTKFRQEYLEAWQADKTR